ncbi:DsbA family protein [Altererythrobacter sp. SALINAS58]|uniref:DsbA family protein n=1 Tax=Alteripontixanthobacter muriae TaxID=2705546 RepID=UPI001574FA06|nr:DsbA family protein [Alteripontixanthobacter muriae]NTZ43938.1 DsbA family protein [Alteripontixanthobacter muriae]
MTGKQLLALLGLIAAGVLTSYLLQGSRPLGRYVGDNASAVATLQDDRSPEVTRGTADLTLVLFTDYQCPACRKADPAMRSAIIKDGNVRVVYKDWPVFGQRSEEAAKVALAAHRQGIYPSVHQALMGSRRLDDAALRAAVERSGGNWQRLQDDLVHHRSAFDDELAKNSWGAFSLGLDGTPGYLIGPFLIEGALNEREFLQAFAHARARISQSGS